MEKENAEWRMLGTTIASLAVAGARPWELRLLALKGKHTSLRDIARVAARHGREMSAPRPVPREGE